METAFSKVLDYYEKGDHYWIQGTSYDFNGGACLFGAVVEASGAQLREGYEAEYVPTLRKIESHLGLELGTGNGTNIPAWNDAPERTFDDIRTVLTELHEKEVANQ